MMRTAIVSVMLAVSPQFVGIAAAAAAEVAAGASRVELVDGEPAAVFHVATSGSDNWSGRLAAPNDSKTDGPFATLQRARDAVRQVKRQQQGGLKQPVTVFVHGGTYPLSQAFGQASQIELGGKAGMPGLPGPNQYLFERNIVCWKREANFLASPWRDTDVVLRNNLYWQEGNSQPKFGPLNWAQWQGRGMDAGSIIADPLFVDPAKNDFHLKPESPALKLGFEPFDLSEVGPR